MNKTEKMFQMMETPQAYTEQEWVEILSDSECRELYMLMVKTQGAYEMQHPISDEDIDAEWQRLPKPHHHHWLHFAAIFTGILMLSGITIAAIINLTFNFFPASFGIDAVHQADTTLSVPLATGKSNNEKVEPFVFDNVPLDKMIQEIAAFYLVEVNIENERTKNLRFHFVWRRDDSLSCVLEQLNQFESVHIVMKDGQMIVK